MHETRQTFSEELEPTSVNIATLTRQIKSSLMSLLKGEAKSLVVDVSSRPTLSSVPEWRLNVPARTPRLYCAISELVNQADMFYREFVSMGAMEPCEFTVSVWCLPDSEASIKGSFD
jgi:hypothetical protein